MYSNITGFWYSLFPLNSLQSGMHFLRQCYHIYWL